MRTVLRSLFSNPTLVLPLLNDLPGDNARRRQKGKRYMALHRLTYGRWGDACLQRGRTAGRDAGGRTPCGAGKPGARQPLERVARLIAGEATGWIIIHIYNTLLGYAARRIQAGFYFQVARICIILLKSQPSLFYNWIN